MHRLWASNPGGCEPSNIDFYCGTIIVYALFALLSNVCVSFCSKRWSHHLSDPSRAAPHTLEGSKSQRLSPSTIALCMGEVRHPTSIFIPAENWPQDPLQQTLIQVPTVPTLGGNVCVLTKRLAREKKFLICKYCYSPLPYSNANFFHIVPTIDIRTKSQKD